MLETKSFYEPDSGTWMHFIGDPESRRGALVDPVWVYDPVSGRADTAFVEEALAWIEERGYALHWILETHAHADHLTAADLIRKKTGARLACGRGICSVQETFAPAFGLSDTPVDGRQFDRLLDEGDEIPLGELRIRVIDTPGHTADSVTYLVGDAAFIGDTLFAPRAGTARCDFPGGDAGQLYDSIQRLHALPPQTRLFLCHDYPPEGEQLVASVTVADSSSQNVHVREGTRREDFVALRNERDAGLGLPRLILPALQINIRAGAAPAAGESGIPHLHIPFNRSMADLISARGRRDGEQA